MAMIKKLLNVYGFTLVEVLVSTVIFAILSGVIALYLGQGMQTWEIGICQSDLQAQARPAMDRMIRELKNTSPTKLTISGTGNDTIKFYLPEDIDGDGLIIDTTTSGSIGNIEWNTAAGNSITYSLNTDLNQLVRIVKDSGENILSQKALCTDVSDITFTKDGDELKITLSLEKITAHGRTIAYSLTSIIKLRN